jgi:dihydrofolate reductase
MDGPDLIVFGSSTLTSVLFDHGLVDEVVLSRRASTG